MTIKSYINLQAFIEAMITSIVYGIVMLFASPSVGYEPLKHWVMIGILVIWIASIILYMFFDWAYFIIWGEVSLAIVYPIVSLFGYSYWHSYLNYIVMLFILLAIHLPPLVLLIIQYVSYHKSKHQKDEHLS